MQRVHESMYPAVQKVMEMMTQIKLDAKEQYTINKPVYFGKLSAIIGLSSNTHSGAIVIHYNQAMAFLVIKAIFATEAISMIRL